MTFFPLCCSEYRAVRCLLGSLVIMLCGGLMVPAEPMHIAGTVHDGTTFENLPLANILIMGTQTGTSTGDGGRFFLTAPGDSCSLLVSKLGYRSVTVFVRRSSDTTRVEVLMMPVDILLQEVAVYANPGREDQEHEVSNLSLQSKEIREISSVIPDVFRALQALPGISADNEFSAKFNVRGGNYDENLVIVNDAQVFEPFHIKEADNATVGIFNVNLMKRVDLITGGFSARYGDRMSSVLNIEYRDGSTERVSGSAMLSMVGVDALLEGPLFSGGSFIVGARKSYLEYVLSLLDVERSAKPSFYDVQGVIAYPLSSVTKLRLQFIHAGDTFSQEPDPQPGGPFTGQGQFNGENSLFSRSTNRVERENSRYYSSLIGLHSTSLMSSSVLVDAGLSYYDQIEREHHLDTFDDNLSITGSRQYFILSHSERLRGSDLEIKTVEGKVNSQVQISPFLEGRAGVSYQRIWYTSESRDEQTVTETFNTDRYPDTSTAVTVFRGLGTPNELIRARSFKLAGYAEALWQISGQLLANLGGRVDYFEFNRETTVSPRLSLSYQLAGGTVFRAAYGFYYQTPIYQQIALPYPSPENTRSQKAIHYVVGGEHPFSIADGATLTLKLEGYYKRYTSLVASTRESGGHIVYSRHNDDEGSAYGCDVFAVLHMPSFYGWISYGWLKAEEYPQGMPQLAAPRYTDQRHTLSLVGDLAPGEGWHFNLRFAYGSGYPYTPMLASYNGVTGRWSWNPGAPNSAFLPAYKRVDVRATKELRIAGLDAEVFLDVSNLLNFANVEGYDYGFSNSGLPRREEVLLFPVVPTLGATIHF